MGVPEHTIRMNQKLGKVMGGWWVHLENSVSSGPFLRFRFEIEINIIIIMVQNFTVKET